LCAPFLSGIWASAFGSSRVLSIPAVLRFENIERSWREKSIKCEDLKAAFRKSKNFPAPIGWEVNWEKETLSITYFKPGVRVAKKIHHKMAAIRRRLLADSIVLASDTIVYFTFVCPTGNTIAYNEAKSFRCG
jgi:hypothetical protein